MTKKEIKRTVNAICRKYSKDNPKFDVNRLTGRGHIKRSVVCHKGMANMFPHDYCSTLVFGNDIFTIIPVDLADKVAKALKIPADIFSTKLMY